MKENWMALYVAIINQDCTVSVALAAMGLHAQKEKSPGKGPNKKIVNLL